MSRAGSQSVPWSMRPGAAAGCVICMEGPVRTSRRVRCVAPLRVRPAFGDLARRVEMTDRVPRRVLSRRRGGEEHVEQTLIELRLGEEGHTSDRSEHRRHTRQGATVAGSTLSRSSVNLTVQVFALWVFIPEHVSP